MAIRNTQISHVSEFKVPSNSYLINENTEKKLSNNYIENEKKSKDTHIFFYHKPSSKFLQLSKNTTLETHSWTTQDNGLDFH